MGFGTPGLTRAWAIDTVTITCSKACKVQLTVYETRIGGNDQMMWRVQVPAGIPLVIPVSTIVRPAVTAFGAGNNGKATIREMYDGPRPV